MQYLPGRRILSCTSHRKPTIRSCVWRDRLSMNIGNTRQAAQSNSKFHLACLLSNLAAVFVINLYKLLPAHIVCLSPSAYRTPVARHVVLLLATTFVYFDTGFAPIRGFEPFHFRRYDSNTSNERETIVTPSTIQI